VTLPEALQARGYATAAYGKWHLGDAPVFNPLRHGFDEFLGIPHSNDMWPPNGDRWPPLSLIENDTVIAEVTPEIQASFTGRLTGAAIDFIDRHQQEPFFVYLAHPMAHVPLYASEAFAGGSAGGLYTDVIEKIDWSVGQILDTLGHLDARRVPLRQRATSEVKETELL